jgi:hypothetical protein
MICAEPVKPSQYAVESLRKPVLKRNFPRLPRNLVHPCGSGQIRGKKRLEEMCPKTNAAQGQPPRAACFVVLNSCHLAARSGGPTVLVRQRSQLPKSATFTSADCRTGFREYDSENRFSATPAAASGPARSEEQTVEEAAMPGQPVRARARFQFPPAIHPRELPAATGVTAIIIRQALRIPRFR